MFNNRDLDTMSPMVIAQIEGKELNLQDDFKLCHFSFDERDDGDDEITIEFVDSYAQTVNDPLLQARNEITVRWGYAGRLSFPRTGIMLEPEKDYGETLKLTIKAYDKGSKLHGRAEQRIWNQMTYSAITSDIARKHGLKPIVEDSKKIIESLPQGGRSDWAFIKFMASEINYDFYVSADELHFHTKDKRKPPVAQFFWFHPKSDYLISFKPRLNIQEEKGEGTETTAVGYDLDSREPLTHAANAGTKGEPALGDKTLMINTDTGDTRYSPTETGLVIATPHQSQGEVEAEAETQRRRAEMDQATAELELVGIPFLSIGQIIDVQGVDAQFAGLWLIYGARHDIGDGGYKTTLALRRDAVDDEKNAVDQDAADSGGKTSDPDKVRSIQINADTGQVEET
ncbi:MAG TPA: contractile injection system protein, VgrG/Pvc8 family [Candidatus Sumerlaeota bacterium]|nr:contractile injection system protein, VgrG/Pvc8 family [Candidatus Sumerlaeota bacterium]